jgi:hypothetical protein
MKIEELVVRAMELAQECPGLEVCIENVAYSPGECVAIGTLPVVPTKTSGRSGPAETFILVDCR